MMNDFVMKHLCGWANARMKSQNRRQMTPNKDWSFLALPSSTYQLSPRNWNNIHLLEQIKHQCCKSVKSLQEMPMNDETIVQANS